MKKSSKSKPAKKAVVKSVAAKVVTTVSKSEKAPTVAQAKTRSMAAYKAHITRQQNALKAAKNPEAKSAAHAAIATITANMRAA